MCCAIKARATTRTTFNAHCAHASSTRRRARLEANSTALGALTNCICLYVLRVALQSTRNASLMHSASSGMSSTSPVPNASGLSTALGILRSAALPTARPTTTFFLATFASSATRLFLEMVLE